jgi:ribose-phosphate pyrophosphokinase
MSGRARTIHAFAEGVGLARAIASRLRARIVRVRVHRFPDGETLMHVATPPGRHAILVSPLDDPNAKLIETVLAADALRRAGARRVTLIAPYLPYMRQDKMFRRGEPISQRVIGALIAQSVDDVITVEPHLHRARHLADAVPCRRAISVSAAPAIAGWIARAAPGALVAGPDAESQRWTLAIARRARLQSVVGNKRRSGDRRVDVSFGRLPAARRAVIVDDIASSGATLAAAARALRRAGISTVDAVVVHAIFASGALALVRRAGIRRIVSCDTIAHPTNAIRCAPLVADALEALR